MKQIKPSEALALGHANETTICGTAVETNAMFAALRLYVAEDQWTEAVNIADQLLQRSFSKAVLTSPSEVAYLKAFSLEQAGRKDEAFAAYLMFRTASSRTTAGSRASVWQRSLVHHAPRSSPTREAREQRDR